MEERRNCRRSRTFLGAKIVFNNRRSSLDCLVRNLSSDGAKIVFADGVAIPSDFEITIHQTAETRRARSVWRNETEVGVLFLRPADEKFVSLEAARRIKKLQNERDALSRRVAKLDEPA